MKVKICGIRTIEAAKAVVKSGADFLGFNFVPNSKRYIPPAFAREIIDLVRDKIKIVGVFQGSEVDKVNKIAADLKLDFVQLHGKEDNEYIRKVSIPVIKSITENDKPDKIKANYFLLDRSNRGKGKMVDLEKVNQLVTKVPIFIAGGLTPDNVAIVVKKVRPYAVDVAGGIEIKGIQDIEKIKLFISNAKGVIS